MDEEKKEETKEIQETQETEDKDIGNDIDSGDFLDLIKQKDKQIEDLQKDIAELKRSNANLIVKVNAGSREPEKTFEDNLFGLVGEPTRRE